MVAACAGANCRLTKSAALTCSKPVGNSTIRSTEKVTRKVYGGLKKACLGLIGFAWATARSTGSAWSVWFWVLPRRVVWVAIHTYSTLRRVD